MCSIECSKKIVILKSLLEKTFSHSLYLLETRTEDHINSLEMIDKQFKQFEIDIYNLTLSSNYNSEKKKIEYKERTSLNNNKKKKIKSKTTTTIHKTKNQNQNQLYLNNYNNNNIFNNQTNNISGRSTIYKSNISIRLNNINSRKTSGDNNNENFKTNKKMDLRSKSLYISRFIDISDKDSENKYSLKNKNIRTLQNDLESPKFFTKSSKEIFDFQFEISNIQEQIKNVENTLNKTEKMIQCKKTRSLEFEKKMKFEWNLIHFFEEKGIMIFKNILIFCNIEDGMNLVSLNKQICKEARVKYVNNIIKKLDERQIDQNIEEMKEKYKNKLNSDVPKFQLSKGSLRAIEVLNKELYLNIFYNDILPKKYKEILIIYKIFVQLIKKEDLIQLSNNDTEFWREISNYFITESKNKLGDFILTLIDNFSFNEENILKMRKMVSKFKNKINALYFSKICGTTGLIIFILKDALEYCGILINERKTPIKRIYENLIREKEIIKKLKIIKNDIQNMQNN